MKSISSRARDVLFPALVLSFCFANCAAQANPLFDGADPDILVDRHQYWIFPTTEDGPKDKFFAYSSSDLLTWRRCAPILLSSDISWLNTDRAPSHELWAPGIFHRNGLYYLFYAVGPQNPTPSRIGVATAVHPEGPYKDSGRPLITGDSSFEAIDPMVFQDPQSGKFLLYCGGSAGAVLRVYELNDDLVSVKKQIAVDTPKNFTEGPFMHFRNDTFFLSYSSGRWNDNSYHVCYATSASPLGPWSYKGEILNSNDRHAGPGHHAIFADPVSGQWYVVYHRWNNANADKQKPSHRSVAIEKLFYDDSGAILPIIMTDQSPNASREKPERISQFVSRYLFGKTEQGTDVWAYVLSNARGLKATVITYGATLVSLDVPDAAGKFADVVLGFNDVSSYEKRSPYFGATIGRVANRIAKANFIVNGTTYTLAANDGENTLHGGKTGFDKRVWEAKLLTPDSKDAAVTFSYYSPDGEENFPGAVKASVTYSLTSDNELKLQYDADVKGDSPLNMTNHSYFNLAGAGSGDILNHQLQLRANFYTPVDSHLIPTGAIEPVANSPMDFTKMKAIGRDIGTVAGGYDHNFVVKRANEDSLVLVARAEEPVSGRVLEMYTTEPGLQFYSGNFLDGTIKGNGGRYVKHGAFCLEAQHFPDALHRTFFPSIMHSDRVPYRQTTVYKFSSAQSRF